MWLHICMGGPMTTYRCDFTSILAAQVVCQPTNFCLLFLSATLSTLTKHYFCLQDVRMKAVLLGALFLIDFMFFEKQKNEENDGLGML